MSEGIIEPIETNEMRLCMYFDRVKLYVKNSRYTRIGSGMKADGEGIIAALDQTE